MGILSSVLRATPRRKTSVVIVPPPSSDSAGRDQAGAPSLDVEHQSIASTDIGGKTEMTQTIPMRRPNKRRQDNELTMDTETVVSTMDIDILPDSSCDTSQAAVTVTIREQNRLFEVPEIIRCICVFLNKPSLAASCRVSRIWYTHCTPLLWRHIVDKNWRDGRFCSAISNQAHNIRSLKCEDWTDYEELLLCEFPRLRSMSLYGSKDTIVVKERLLNKVQSTLLSLALSAVCSDLLSDSMLVSIQSLQQLTTLKLLNLTLMQDQLSKIFLLCHKLEFLSLTRIAFQDEHDDVFDGSSSVIRSEAWATRGATRIKYLTFKEVALESEYLGMLLCVCPALLELSIARNESLYISLECLTILKKSCPGLYALDVGSCKQLDRDTFGLVFASFPLLTVINLSGTTISDPGLLLVANNCKKLLRLDIHYCTSITSKGLHQFLSKAGPSLRHLESSGIIMDPTTFDNRAWTCTLLQILFLDVGLFAPANGGSPVVDINRVALHGASEVLGSGHGETSCNQESKLAVRTGHETDNPTSSPSLDEQRHPLHPVQNVCHLQYLGVMGGGPKLTASKPSKLLRGFSSVKRLHVLGLYQTFKREDIEWIMTELPELCRIDAEHYNISNELLAWFTTAYPNVRVCRKESD